VSARLVNPFVAGSIPAIDPDAADYIKRVESVDGEGLELLVKAAINVFVVGCKEDGIWSAIKASCILAGARTLNGALVPLVGTAPTNAGGLFLPADYNRETGLVGDRATKYLDTNRLNNADPQDSNHNAIWASNVGTYDSTASAIIGSEGVGDTGTNIILHVSTQNGVFVRNRNSSGSPINAVPVAGLIGANRSSSSQFVVRNNGTSIVISTASQAPEAKSVFVFRRQSATFPSHANARIAFYSIGESLDLALLDSRVSTLITSIGAAIP